MSNLDFQPQEKVILHLSILTEPISTQEMIDYLKICDPNVDEEEFASKILEYRGQGWIISGNSENGQTIELYTIEEKLQNHILNSLSLEERRPLHMYANLFYEGIFKNVAAELNESETESLIQPIPFINILAHLPQIQDVHLWVLVRSYHWQVHLLALKKFDDVAHLANATCFALARRGQSRIAEEMLRRSASITKGYLRATILTNLATLLRGEGYQKEALQIYWKVLPVLLRPKTLAQTAAVLSEMANAYHYLNKTYRAILIQEFSSIIRTLIKDKHGLAICHNQLSNLYRSTKLYGGAILYNRYAEKYFRQVNDRVNLAKNLLSKGNIYQNIRQPTIALDSFKESYEISLEVNDHSTTASALGGQGRAYLSLGDFTKAKDFLEQAIIIRQRFGDHWVGIEYENLGSLYEIQGNYGLALGWYQKALPYFSKYHPVYVPSCERKIHLMKSKTESKKIIANN